MTQLPLATRSGFIFSLLALACSGDVVDLGGGEAPGPRGPVCAESTAVGGSVLVTQQSELDALLGCERIDGDLSIEVFAGADLTPLAALREVGGALTLGAYPQPIPDEEGFDYRERVALADEIIEQGYLPSLHGLEALERVGTIGMNGIHAPDLLALQNLRSVDSPRYFYGGVFQIGRAPNLLNLEGIEGLLYIGMLSLEDCPSLESLSGLVAPLSLEQVALVDLPKLSDLSALSATYFVSSFVLDNVGVRNLDALRDLGQVNSLALQRNNELENIDRISQLFWLESLSISRNSKLASVPSLANLSGGLSSAIIDANDGLRSIALELPASATEYIGRGRSDESSVGFFEVTRNPALQTLVLARGLEKADYVAVSDNASLASIDFGSLFSLDTLEIEDNPTLASIERGALERVDILTVLNNPLLPLAPLSEIRTFESVMRGNADEPPTPAP